MKAVAALAALSLFVLPACRRPAPDLSARMETELAGGWVREIREGVAGVEGFDLRADGSVALLGIFSMNGIAWTVSRNELVISTNTDRYVKPNPIRLGIASLEGDVLTLDADPPEYLAGTYRRSGVDRVTGVVTYLERAALPADARVEVRLMRGARLLARALITPKGAVPIPFALSFASGPGADTSADALEASIVADDRRLFATSAPVPVGSGSGDVELLVRRTPGLP